MIGGRSANLVLLLMLGMTGLFGCRGSRRPENAGSSPPPQAHREPPECQPDSGSALARGLKAFGTGLTQQPNTYDEERAARCAEARQRQHEAEMRQLEAERSRAEFEQEQERHRLEREAETGRLEEQRREIERQREELARQSTSDAREQPVLAILGGTAHDVFLGCLCDPSHPESIFNPFGQYGRCSLTTDNLFCRSALKEFGSDGVSREQSACTRSAGGPPVLVDQFGTYYGRFSVADGVFGHADSLCNRHGDYGDEQGCALVHAVCAAPESGLKAQ